MGRRATALVSDMSIDSVQLNLERMRQQAQWGKQSHAHATVSFAFAVESLLDVAEAAIAEHASHFEEWKDDEEGCAICYYLNKLGA
jgi:hypothetical protein